MQIQKYLQSNNFASNSLSLFLHQTLDIFLALVFIDRGSLRPIQLMMCAYFFSHFLSSSNDCQREGLLDHCEDISAEENNANTAQDSSHWSSPRTWSQASDHSFTSWKKRLRHSIEVVRQFRGRRPREYSINEDAPSLRPPAPPGSHTTILSIFARLNELCDYFQSLQMPYRPLELSHNFFGNIQRI